VVDTALSSDLNDERNTTATVRNHTEGNCNTPPRKKHRSAHLSRDDRHLVRINQRPRSGVRRVPVQRPHERHDKGVVLPGVAELVPPVFADWVGQRDAASEDGIGGGKERYRGEGR
jgi:hypothetical protein